MYARDGIDSRSWFPPDDVDGQYVGELFKALKGNLRLKTFVGTSENALQTPIWTGLIAMLLIKYLQLRASFGWSLSNLVALLRQQLFVYRDLWNWIDNPFQPPPLLTPTLEQLKLGL